MVTQKRSIVRLLLAILTTLCLESRPGLIDQIKSALGYWYVANGARSNKECQEIDDIKKIFNDDPQTVSLITSLAQLNAPMTTIKAISVGIQYSELYYVQYAYEKNGNAYTVEAAFCNGKCQEMHLPIADVL